MSTSNNTPKDKTHWWVKVGVIAAVVGAIATVAGVITNLLNWLYPNPFG